jgi:hypothetical protein
VSGVIRYKACKADVNMINNNEMNCDTCGKKVSELRRDVIEVAYNALNKPPLWTVTKKRGLKGLKKGIFLDPPETSFFDGFYGCWKNQNRKYFSKSPRAQIFGYR